MKKHFIINIGENPMKNPTKKLAIALLTLCTAAFAQPEPTKNTEAELFAKQQAMLKECVKIMKAVPCAVGVGDVDNLTSAQQRAERDARHKLAQSIKAFVSSVATDSSLVEDGASREFSRQIDSIKIDNIIVANSATISIEYAVITNEINGKKFYRALAQMVLNPQLYAEAREAIATAQKDVTLAQREIARTPQSNSSQATQPNRQQVIASSSSTEVEIPKTDFKRIATKTVKFLLGLIL